jgi:mRNA interferase MazF
MNRHLDSVVVCPLTTKLHPRWRSRIEAPCAGRQAEIAVDQIRKISELRLGRRIDALDTSTASRLRRLITEMNGE